MSWRDTLLDTSFRGIVFDCISTDDAADHVLVEHSYPYVDGADVENMGRRSRKISVQAIFYGDNYESALQEFEAALAGKDEQNGVVPSTGSGQAQGGWLQHPVFGLMFVQVASYKIRHDAEKFDQASVSIEFVESTTAATFFSREVASQKAEDIKNHGTQASAAASEVHGSVIDRLRVANPLSALDQTRASMIQPLLALTTGISVTLSGLDVLAYPRAWGNDISAIVNNLLDVYDWREQLEQDWISIRNDLNAFAIFKKYEASSQISAGTTPTEDQAGAAVAVTIVVNSTVTLANAAGLMMVSEADTATRSPVQIEAIVNIARADIDATIEQVSLTYSIEQSRTITEPLKNQALALQTAARAIIEARPPLISRTVKTPGNLRLIAHAFYGDHNRASELQRLNNLRLPNFVQAGDSLHAYSR